MFQQKKTLKNKPIKIPILLRALKWLTVIQNLQVTLESLKPPATIVSNFHVLSFTPFIYFNLYLKKSSNIQKNLIQILAVNTLIELAYIFE